MRRTTAGATPYRRASSHGAGVMAALYSERRRHGGHYSSAYEVRRHRCQRHRSPNRTSHRSVSRSADLGADEHILCALSADWWLLARKKGPEARPASDHVLLTALVSSALPHLLKSVFDQERPDRRTVRGHWRGISFSGNRLDAFPSGHAVHIGAAGVGSQHPSGQTDRSIR